MNKSVFCLLRPRIVTSILCLVLLPIFGSAQGLNHQPLRCHGPIPPEFSRSVSQTIKSIDTSKDIGFELRTRLSDHDLFKSGNVIYGDQVSSYLDSIGQNIIRLNGLEQHNIKFYVIRSAVRNAMSSYQGTIFMTTDFIAKASSEEEIAFVLCHELAHYLLEHSLKKFELKTELSQSRGKRDNTDEQLSEYYKYSRENEMAADSLGYELYRKTEYNKLGPLKSLQNLSPDFDWTKGYRWDYSYLEDLNFRLPWYYSRLDSIFHPKFIALVPTETALHILAKGNKQNAEAEKNTHSSHPDWDERLIRMGKQMNFSLAQLKSYIGLDLPELEEFKRVRRLCRMDLLFLYMQRAQYVKAHYYALQLEHTEGQSKELDYYQTISLNNIYFKYIKNKSKVDLLDGQEVKFGETWKLNYANRFFMMLSEDEWLAILARENITLSREFPSVAVDHYRNQVIGLMKEKLGTDINDFADQTACQAHIWYKEQTLNEGMIAVLEGEAVSHAFTYSVRHEDSSFVRFMFGSSLASELKPDNLYSRSLMYFYHGEKRRPNKYGDLKDTITVTHPEVNAYNLTGRSFQKSAFRQEYFTAYIDSLQSKYGAQHGLVFDHLTPSDSMITTEVWNAQNTLRAWVEEKFLSLSSDIIPVYSNFTQPLSAVSTGNLHLYTYYELYEVDPEGSSGKFFQPITKWFKIKDKELRKEARTVEVVALVDIEHNRMVLGEIQVYQAPYSTDMLKSHLYATCVLLKEAINEKK